MAVYKQFKTNEVVVAPFNANKRFAYSGYSITSSNVGIEYYQSKQGPYTSGSNPTGLITILDEVLVFNSIKQLYYSNYLTSSTGDSVTTASLIPGATSTYDEYVGPITGIAGPAVISVPSKLFGERIPPGQFQFEYTSSLNFTRSLVSDDGEGNLMATYNSGEARVGVTDPTLSEKVGDIFYSQGMAIFTGPDSGTLSGFPDLMGLNGDPTNYNNNTHSSSIQFSSSIQIRENQYKCIVRENEYSYTTNPSALRPLGELNKSPNQLSGSINSSTYGNNGTPGIYSLPIVSTTGNGASGTANITIISDGTISDITVNDSGRSYLPNDEINITPTTGTGIINFILTSIDVTVVGTNATNGSYYDFATGSYFSPYVTTIGLYNKNFQLIAVAKLAQPIPISLYVDTTFIVNFDTW